ncbi:MAG: IS630 family transposase [Candidatus Binatia bacterium]
MNIRYRVALTAEERQELATLISRGTTRARHLRRAQVLLAADAGIADEAMAQTIGVSLATVYRVKRRFVERGVPAALHDDPRPGAERKLTATEEALLVATACSTPPPGRRRWTLELLAGALVRLTDHTQVSRETVRRRLHEKDLKPWQKKMWCIPAVSPEFVARMEDVLDLYTTVPPRTDPVVCFDETPTQLIGETRTPLPPRPGQPQRYDYEYRRNGTANLFVFLDAHHPWRHVKVTAHRTSRDLAECMRDLVDLHYPQAHRIRVVLDNLSTHTPAALYATFPPEEARRLLRRLEFHYTPKHASWLNMVEIEIGVLARQCLDRRLEDLATLQRETAAWNQARNESGIRITWLFNVQGARERMRRVYPQHASAAAAA